MPSLLAVALALSYHVLLRFRPGKPHAYNGTLVTVLCNKTRDHRHFTYRGATPLLHGS